MKKIVVMLIAVSLVVAGYVMADNMKSGKLDLKAGDTIYACNCGDSCPCKSLSRTETNCTCDKKMVKATVAKVDGDKVMLTAAGWDKERAFPTKGKYACAAARAATAKRSARTRASAPAAREMAKVM